MAFMYSMYSSNSSRRRFIQKGSLLAAGFVAPGTQFLNRRDVEEPGNLEFHIFSKHLQFLDYQDMAEAAAEIGFDGIDLTVRPKGHVLPENVVEDLPEAVAAIQKVGLKHDMMATGVNNAADEVNRKVLKTASDLGVSLYRLSYLNFPEDKSIPEAIAIYNEQLKKLAMLNKNLGIIGAYQNHSGTRLGAAIWDIHNVLEGIDRDEIGCQYDIRHAVVEGGASWKTGLRLIRPKINCIVLKDFVWSKESGTWKIKNVPLGMGMVDFDAYFKLLKQMKINVPVTVHYEYSLEGVEHGAKELSPAKHKLVFAAMKKDLEYAKQKWADA